ncbi:MAG: hypothetical protein ACYC6Y_27560, partial [Thermoguttaceae bacterium]
MSRRKRQQLMGQGPKKRRWSRHHTLWFAILLAVIVLAVFARTGLDLWAKRAALVRLRAGAISDARRYLHRAATIAPDDGNID